MLIRVTDRNDDTTILLNPSYILMIRPIDAGGSTIYLASGSLHHPDLLTVHESVRDIEAAMAAAGIEPDAAQEQPAAAH